MHKIQFDEDIQPLSEFSSKVAFYFEKAKRTKRPLIIWKKLGNINCSGCLLKNMFMICIFVVETL
jgi:hypothetical protein